MDREISQRLTYAGFWRRLLAHLLDSLIFAPLVALVIWLSPVSRGMAAVLWTSIQVSFFGYAVYFHRRWGQTLGKMAAGIRVVRTDGLPISWGESFLRSSVDIGFALLGAFGWLVALARIPAAEYAALGWEQQLQRVAELDPVPLWVGHVQMLWISSEFVVLLLNEKRRAVHDFIAGTVVVRARLGGAGSTAV